MKTEIMQYCVDIAETENFTKAAEKNHITQQALSRLIKNLEDELGFQIFERSSREVKVTPPGEIFIANASIILRQLNMVVQSARAYSSGKKTVLSIGYNGPFHQLFLAKTLSIFQTRFADPKVEINLIYESSHDVIQDFQEGRFDLIAIGDYTEFDPERYNTLQIQGGELCAVLGKSHPLANKKSVTAEELLDEIYVSLDFRKYPKLYRRSMKRCKSMLGQLPKRIRFVDDTESVDIIVSSGYGFTFLSSRLAEFYKTSVLAYVPVKDTHVIHNYLLIWGKDNSSSVLESFIAAALEASEQDGSFTPV